MSKGRKCEIEWFDPDTYKMGTKKATFIKWREESKWGRYGIIETEDGVLMAVKESKLKFIDEGEEHEADE